VGFAVDVGFVPKRLSLHVALFEPEIPHNTGAVARLCVATGSSLHLIGRLGFHLDDAKVRRAGLDYWRHVELHRHDDLAAFAERFPRQTWYSLSTRGERNYCEAHYIKDAVLLFGSETKGLPASCIADRDHCWRIPILDDRVRSLNLATAVGIVLYEALRQNGFKSGAGGAY
jgi:tRNA (cytidine/uridine-2'-O-)-methyltransferase